jgi:two-component system alkaline phosphatase synthesis response regulator PhoP
MAKLLIVEDDGPAARTLEKYFAPVYEVITARNGDDGLAYALDQHPDVVILDITLPGLDGLTICKHLREGGFTAPILFLTAKDTEVDLLAGFGVGADDYITKPVSLLVLEARIRAAMRRARASEPAQAADDVFEWDGIIANFTTREVSARGEMVSLSAKELELLKFFVHNRGKVLSREVLLENVWGYKSEVSSRTVDTHVLNLRRKIQDRSGGCRYIQTVHAVGYRFVP